RDSGSPRRRHRAQGRSPLQDGASSAAPRPGAGAFLAQHLEEVRGGAGSAWGWPSARRGCRPCVAVRLERRTFPEGLGLLFEQLRASVQKVHEEGELFRTI